MGIVVYDRVQETTTTTGTGSVTLLGAVTGYQSFAVVGNGGQTYYCIADQGGANWEVGVGTYSTTGPTLARTTIFASSNSGSLVNFTTGTKTVFITYPAEKNISQDSIYAPGTFNGVYGGDGIVVDYTTGNGRISVGSADNLTLYNGGVGNTPIIEFNQYGAIGVGSGSNFGTSGQVLQSNGASAAPSWGSVTASPAGSNTQVQYNNSGAFGASSSFTFDGTTQSAPIQKSSNGITVNTATVASSYTIAAGDNGFSVGPMTINSGAAVTVSPGQRWVVI